MALGIRGGHHDLFETYVDVRMCEIKCAICEKVVDKVVREKNLCTDTLIYTVYCHGDKDTCELTHYQLHSGEGRIEPGYAFTTKRIDGPDERSMDMSNVYEGDCSEVNKDTPTVAAHRWRDLMDEAEQTQLQIWLTGLRDRLEVGEVDDVKRQLDIALGRIEEDKSNERAGSTPGHADNHVETDSTGASKLGSSEHSRPGQADGPSAGEECRGTDPYNSATE